MSMPYCFRSSCRAVSMAMMQYFASANAWSASDNWTWSCVEVYAGVAEALRDDLTTPNSHPSTPSFNKATSLPSCGQPDLASSGSVGTSERREQCSEHAHAGPWPRRWGDGGDREPRTQAARQPARASLRVQRAYSGSRRPAHCGRAIQGGSRAGREALPGCTWLQGPLV